MKINLGCGKLPLEGYKNIDRSPDAKADEYYDIEEGIQEKIGTVDEINAGCVLEQVDNLMAVMNECWRVLKDGGKLIGYVPSTDPRVMFLDPNDKRFFKVDSFEYFDKSKHAWKEFGQNYGYKGWSSATAELHDNGIIHFTMIK